MTVYTVTRKTQSWYGEQIGILILDAAYPCVPGNVGNATTYDYPVRFQEVHGASIEIAVAHVRSVAVIGGDLDNGASGEYDQHRPIISLTFRPLGASQITCCRIASATACVVF